MNEIKEIKEICERINKEEEFSAQVVETNQSLTIVLTDNDASYEEVIHIIPEQRILDINDSVVHIISEGVDYTKLTLDEFYKNFKENWSELKWNYRNKRKMHYTWLSAKN